MKQRTLSKHFSEHEFTFSQTAARSGKQIIIPEGGEVQANLIDLCGEVLEPLRSDLKRPIRITSGYRPPWLNRKIGGSQTSQHCAGQAADIVVPGIEPIDVARAVADSELEYDQCIVEFGRWVHISYAKGNNRNQMLTASRAPSGSTCYALLEFNGVVA